MNFLDRIIQPNQKKLAILLNELKTKNYSLHIHHDYQKIYKLLEKIEEYIYTSYETRDFFAAYSMGLTKELVRLIEEDTDSRMHSRVRDISLEILSLFSMTDENRRHLLSPELQLLSILPSKISPPVKVTKTCRKALALLLNLSVDTECSDYMASVKYNIIPLLLQLIDPFALEVGNSSSPSLTAEGILPNMKVLNHISTFLSPSEDEISPLTIAERAISILWNIAENGDDRVADLMIFHYQTLTISYRLLENVGTVVKNWIPTIPKLLNMLMNLARHENSRDAFKSLPFVEYMIELVKAEYVTKSPTYIKAIFILSFLIGQDESHKHLQPILTQEDINTIINVFKHTLASEDGKDYPLGTFCLRLIIQACLCISRADDNKPLLLNSPIIQYLTQVLHHFQDNAPPIYLCGGGGSDIESAELAIETLLHLSFNYQNDDSLIKDYCTYQHGKEKVTFLQLCSALIENKNLPFSSKLKLKEFYLRLKSSMASQNDSNVQEELSSSKKSMPSAVSSSERLSIPPDPEETFVRNTSATSNEATSSSSSITSEQKPKHVMLSYCWQKGGQPHLVKLLAKELRSQGYDVWRDEEGSLLLPAVQGSVDHRLAEAVESSAVVILCISAAYKNSANCRMEASYASVLVKRGLIQLNFVMMNEDYTTVSHPNYCDGWLGMLIGDQLWYPGWSEELIHRSAKELLVHLPETTKVSYGDRETLKLARMMSTASIASQSMRFSDPDTPTTVRSESEPQTPRMGKFSSRLSITSSATVSIEEDPLTAAWNILQTPIKIKDELGLKQYLEEIGVIDVQELKSCDEEYLQAIAQFLKVIPQKSFLTLMHEYHQQ